MNATKAKLTIPRQVVDIVERQPYILQPKSEIEARTVFNLVEARAASSLVPFIEKSKRAAIYVRVSSERQAGDDRVSIEAQLAECEAYCQERGYTIVARYIDKEKYRVKGKLVQPSGQRKDRPQYQAMLKGTLSGEFDVIVAWKEDRLYRGMYAAMPFSEVLDEMGKRLEVELVKETFDQKMLGVKAALGKIEVDNIRERMLMGRRARLEKGEVPGGDQVKYGYCKVNKRLEIDKAEAEIVEQIFAWYISGENNMQIRRRLNAKGILPRRGSRWAKPTIETILTTEAYATGKMSTVLDGETFTIPCTPIIAMEIWNKAKEVRVGNRSLSRNVKEDYLCVGLVYCTCGWKCKARAWHGNKNKGYNSVSGYYACPRYDTDPESRPPDCAHTTGSKKVDDHVWNYVKRICSKPTILREAIVKKLAALEAEQEELSTEVERLQKILDELIMERQWVITQARKGKITEDDMEMQLAALQLQEMSYRKELDERAAIAAAQKQAEVISNWSNQYLSEINTGIQALDVDLKTLTASQRQAIAIELEAWQFAEKFPGDELAQLRRAILEAKRRVVRALISRVIVGKGENGTGRKITPVLTFDIPATATDSLAYGDQSLDYEVTG